MIRRVFSWLILLSVLVIPTIVSAQRDRDTYNPNNQAFEVSGQVNAAETKEPVRDIPIRLERFSGGIIDQVATDSRGRFRFTNLQRGYYKVIVNASGYDPAQQDADLTFLFKTYLVFTLVANKPASLSTLTGPGEVIDARIPAEAREAFAQGKAALSKKSYPEAIAHLQKAIAA